MVLHTPTDLFEFLLESVSFNNPGSLRWGQVFIHIYVPRGHFLRWFREGLVLYGQGSGPPQSKRECPSSSLVTLDEVVVVLLATLVLLRRLRDG